MSDGMDSENVVAANDVVDTRSVWAGSRIIMHIDMNAFFAAKKSTTFCRSKGT